MGTQATQSNAPQSPADRAGAVGNETKDATKDVAATAGQEAQRVTREAKDQARQLWGQTRSDLTDQASQQQTRAASSLRELADQLNQMARSGDQSGVAAGLVDDVARRAGDAASWLDSRDPGSLLEEARSFARRRPGAFLAIAAGVGVVAGRLSRSLVDEAREESSGPSGTSQFTGTTEYAGTTGYVGTTGYGETAGYGGTTSVGTGSLGATGIGDAGMPSATSPTTRTTASVPVTPGASPEAVGAGAATVPGDELPGAHRSSQPIMPDGTPTPIDDEGMLGAPVDDDVAFRGER
jgi:hypothetical protein